MALELELEQAPVLAPVPVLALPQVRHLHLPVLALVAPELAQKLVLMQALGLDQDLVEGEVVAAEAVGEVAAVAAAQATVMVRVMAMGRVTGKEVVIKELVVY